MKPDSYTTIAILPIFTEVFEKLILNSLEAHCTKTLLIYVNQYGFLKGRSTALTVLNMTEKIKKNIENKVRIFIDPLLSLLFD